MDPKKPLNIADKKRLEINSDSVTSYIRNTKMFGGQASIKAISEFPGNDICADCRRKENEWVSLKIGIFICIDCARIHKTLGKEFAEVQSIKHDAVIWDLEKIQFLEAAGNLMMNNIYEHRLPSYYLTPNELIDSPFVRKNFISVKYLEKLFLKTDRNLHENEINEKDHLVVEGCPFYKMPQNPLTFEGEYRSEKKQKGSRASMILINSILSVYKSEKDKNPKATIEIEKAKIDLTNRIVKGLQEYSIKVASKDKCHFFDMRETSGIIDIVHSMRRASAFYSTNPNQKLSNILPKNMMFEKAILENSAIKGMAKVSGSKKWIVLVDENLYFFKSQKNVSPNGCVLLRESLIKEHKQNSIMIVSPFQRVIVKLSDAEETTKWLFELKKVGETLNEQKLVDFKDLCEYEK